MTPVNKKLITAVNKQVMIGCNKLAPMSEPHDRLRKAREAAGYATATAAADAMGVKTPTYVHHENGTAGLSRSGQRYARFFNVDFEWLMTGRGAMRPQPPVGEWLEIRLSGF